jgi:hypothetical protein
MRVEAATHSRPATDDRQPTRSRPADRVSGTAHAVMAVAMVTMIGWHPVAPGWVPGLFTAIGLWFFALAVPPGQRLPNLHHAAMAGTMAGMTASHHLNGVAAAVLAAYFSLAAVAWLRKTHIGHAAMTAAMAAMLLAA